MKLLEEILADDEQRLSQLERTVVNLINGKLETAATVKSLIEEIGEIRQAQRKTDERLDALTLRIEKFLSDKSNDA